MVLLTRIERVASPLPRECSTTELQERNGRILEMNCGVAQPLVYKRVHGGVVRLALHSQKAPELQNFQNLERVNGIEPSS